MDHDSHELEAFQQLVWEFFAAHQRNLPWRQPETDGSFDPYKILVSEIMLQQTQVSRVIPKFEAFLTAFPTVQALAGAKLAAVLRAWQGLGYNRRAKFLWQAAQRIVSDFNGVFPETSQDLQTLPGVGINTAGAILVYAFNKPVPFIETNIRTVFIHHFFPETEAVSDDEIHKLVLDTMDMESPRQWFWALMDYGSYLKTEVGNLARASKSYAKQSPFAGSRRQLRGQIIRSLGEQPYELAELQAIIHDDRLLDVLGELQIEELIQLSSHKYSLA